MKRSPLTAGLLALVFLAIPVLTLIGFTARSWMPPVASEHGAGVDGVIQYLVYTTAVIFAIGHLVLAAFVWRYGRRDTAERPDVRRRTETLWSVLPVLAMTGVAEVGVFAMAMPVWGQIYAPTPENALVVEVTGKQFEWLVRYPGRDGVLGRTIPERVDGMDNPAGLDRRDPPARDDVILINEIHLPAGRPVLVQLRARDVLHSFAIPAFRVKQDCVPGLCLGTLFTPTTPGRYELACAELCGLGHFRMRGFVIVHTPEEFEQWQAAQVGWFE